MPRSYAGMHQGVHEGRAESAGFQPDVFTPTQWNDLRDNAASNSSPEALLALAVLEDAVRSFQKSVSPGKARLTTQEGRLAEDWICSGSDGYVFDFKTICHWLKINPVWLRQGLLKWKEDVMRSGRSKPSVKRTRVVTRHRKRR